MAEGRSVPAGSVGDTHTGLYSDNPPTARWRGPWIAPLGAYRTAIQRYPRPALTHTHTQGSILGMQKRNINGIKTGQEHKKEKEKRKGVKLWKLPRAKTGRQGEAEKGRDSSGHICSNREKKHSSVLPPTSKRLLFQMSGQLDTRPCVCVGPSWFDLQSLNLDGQMCCWSFI